VPACIAFKQPISEAEIHRLFDTDKRGVVKLRDLKIVEEFAGDHGPPALHDYRSLLAGFGLASSQELNRDHRSRVIH
jgi:chromosome segregation and condensation protein ScpB